MKTALLLFIEIFLFAKPLYAEQTEEYVQAEFIRNLETQLELADTNTKLNLLYFESQKRINLLKNYQAQGLNSNSKVLHFLDPIFISKLEKKRAAHEWTWNRAVWEESLIKEKKLCLEIANELKKTFQVLYLKNPLILKTMQYLALSRSETLSDGQIGEWNPAPSETIQKSAEQGLEIVLSDVRKLWESQKPHTQVLKIDTLIDYHKTLLGAASHHFSQPGQINDIYFKNTQGDLVSVYKILKQWETDLNSKPITLETAIESYMDFLHWHPFGDSNGRIAEIVRQIFLAHLGLPPLFTFEKSAIENYSHQNLFGRGHFWKNTNTLLKETQKVLSTLEELTNLGWIIKEVRLSGSNIILHAQNSSENKIFILTKSFQVKGSLPLPPIRGNPVLVDTDPKNLVLKSNSSHWKVNHTPHFIYPLKREGNVKVALLLYEVQAPLEQQSSALNFEFAYFYKHPNSSHVWFNNHGKNYQVHWSKLFGELGKKNCTSILRQALRLL